MTINIHDIADIDKLLAFLRVRARASFDIADGLLQELVSRITKWARNNDFRVRFVIPDAAPAAALTGAGAACGLAAGLLAGLAGLPLVAAGMAGAAAGYAAAHVTITFGPAGTAGTTAVTIA
jgi:hypothetical protein